MSVPWPVPPAGRTLTIVCSVYTAFHFSVSYHNFIWIVTLVVFIYVPAVAIIYCL